MQVQSSIYSLTKLLSFTYSVTTPKHGTSSFSTLTATIKFSHVHINAAGLFVGEMRPRNSCNTCTQSTSVPECSIACGIYLRQWDIITRGFTILGISQRWPTLNLSQHQHSSYHSVQVLRANQIMWHFRMPARTMTGLQLQNQARGFSRRGVARWATDKEQLDL